jgi:hypothetical protein
MKRLISLKSFQKFKIKIKKSKPIAVDVLLKAYPKVPLSCTSNLSRTVHLKTTFAFVPSSNIFPCLVRITETGREATGAATVEGRPPPPMKPWGTRSRRCTKNLNTEFKNHRKIYLRTSVADPNPDVFGPPGSRSISVVRIRILLS